MRVRRFWPGILLLGLLMVVLLASISAAASANTVPSSRVENISQPITPNDLKPTQCTMTIDRIVDADGNVRGSGNNDLILGGPGNDTITGRGGNDCILGGGGNDYIDGGAGGSDVCIGGPGTDTFNRCETAIQ